MEKICDLARINIDLQKEIDILEDIIENLEQVNTGDIWWAHSVVLDIVATNLRDQVQKKVLKKDLNKEKMSNLLVQALPQ